MKFYLIQRLEKDFSPPPKGVNVSQYYAEFPKYNEKAKIKYSPEIAAINNLFQLDYMGSAEFEFDSFGKALRGIHQSSDKMKVSSLEIKGVPYRYIGYEGPISYKPKTVNIYIWCINEQFEEIKKFVESQSSGENKYGLKERTNLQEGLFGRNNWKGELEESRIIGWLDIQNYWLASTNLEFIRLAKNLLTKI